MFGRLSLPVVGSIKAFRFEACAAFGQFRAFQFPDHVEANFLAAGCCVGG